MPQPEQVPSFAVVHREPFIQRSLGSFLTAGARYKVDLTATDGKGLKQAVALGLSPVLLLLCMEEACASGMALLFWAANQLPNACVLLLGREAAPEGLPEAFCAGAHGYFCTRESPDRLHLLVENLLAGAVHFPAETFTALRQRPKQPTSLAQGTKRRPSPIECEFLRWLVHPDDFTYAEIAQRMNRSLRVVEKYRYELCKRYLAKRRAGLMSLARELGLDG